MKSRYKRKLNYEKIIKRIVDWWNRKNEPNIPKLIHVEGYDSKAIGKNDDIVLMGVCNHPQKRVIEEDYLKDNLSVSEFTWTHCIYCVDGKYYYASNCQYKNKNEEN